ncbi:MAG: hypothetical protein AB7E46_05405 [Desulfovibrio sp.]
MTIREFESAFWDVERIFIVIRGDQNALVGDYDYERRMGKDFILSDLRIGRIDKLVKGFSYTILDGELLAPHGKTKLSTIRESYR